MSCGCRFLDDQLRIVPSAIGEVAVTAFSQSNGGRRHLCLPIFLAVASVRLREKTGSGAVRRPMKVTRNRCAVGGREAGPLPSSGCQAKLTAALRRLRIAAPAMPKPPTIIIQLDGSGAALVTSSKLVAATLTR